MRANELDVVRLKSGEDATVLEVFEAKDTDALIYYDVEIADEIITISEEDIMSILYRAY